MITIVPSLAVLGSAYWTTISVAFISTAVYPIITCCFIFAMKTLHKVSIPVIEKINRVVFRRGGLGQQQVNMGIKDLCAELSKERAGLEFNYYNGKDENRVCLNQSKIASFIKKFFILKNCHFIMSADITEFKKYIDKNDNMSNTITNTAFSLATTSLILNKQHFQEMAIKSDVSEGLKEIMENKPIQFHRDDLIKHFIKNCSEEEMEYAFNQIEELQPAV